MGMGKDVRVAIAKRAAQEIRPGMVVNLGIGIPSLVPDYMSSKQHVFFHSENGILGISDVPGKGEEDENLCNAGGFPVTLRNGGSYFDSSAAFGMIRSGKIDVTILGALQVSTKGDLANWIVPGKKVPGMGGAMELAAKAKKVIVTMSQSDNKGLSKIVEECTLPYTAKSCVSMIITEMAVFTIGPEGFTLRELFSPYSIEEVQKQTDADFAIADKIITL
ncbi:3-oxoacid CoA-transferase subunit B [Bacillus sp. 1P06AnD]|uniref:3-oxoacid CoA-transferase subunit B n=1 Tax=Bacillus sp. 1P06AnD TaxID=3132208 RepID=UPI00399FCF7B